MLFHEMWRDEMRALSIAIQAPSYFDIPSCLKNEGHPVLWYVLLKLSYDIFHTTSVLPVLSILFATGIVFILFFRSPLPLLFSAIIAFGAWCLYDYGINCRNYGIGAFLMLLFADVRLRRPGSYILQALILVFACQANVYSAVLVLFLGCWMFMEAPIETRFSKSMLIAGSMICASFLFTLFVTLPDENSLVVGEAIGNTDRLGDLWDIGFGFDQALYVSFQYKHGFITLVLLISMLVFLPRPKTMLLVYASAVVMTFFSLCIRHNYLQHIGTWFYFFITLLYVHFNELKAYALQYKKH